MADKGGMAGKVVKRGEAGQLGRPGGGAPSEEHPLAGSAPSEERP